MTGPRLMLLSRLWGLLVFGDALSFDLLFPLGGAIPNRGRYPATKRSAIFTASDFLAAALTR